jgi:hypothetical protein
MKRIVVQLMVAADVLFDQKRFLQPMHGSQGPIDKQ